MNDICCNTKHILPIRKDVILTPPNGPNLVQSRCDEMNASWKCFAFRKKTIWDGKGKNRDEILLSGLCAQNSGTIV